MESMLCGRISPGWLTSAPSFSSSGASRRTASGEHLTHPSNCPLSTATCANDDDDDDAIQHTHAHMHMHTHTHTNARAHERRRTLFPPQV